METVLKFIEAIATLLAGAGVLFFVIVAGILLMHENERREED